MGFLSPCSGCSLKSLHHDRRFSVSRSGDRKDGKRVAMRAPRPGPSLAPLAPTTTAVQRRHAGATPAREHLRWRAEPWTHVDTEVRLRVQQTEPVLPDGRVPVRKQRTTQRKAL